MAAASPARVQFVISGKFIALLLVAVGLLGGDYHWYSQQQQAQKRFHNPPYFVNRYATIVRPCQLCLGLDQLKPQSEWKVGPPTEISATEQRWSKFIIIGRRHLHVRCVSRLGLPYEKQHRKVLFFFAETCSSKS